MALTTEQSAAALAPGSVAVTAGAGTGKTHMLTERYVHHLRAQRLSPLEIVAVTFTEKAAAELRGRIRSHVASALPGRPELVSELEAATIGTLHALASRICREHPEAADVPPDFQVLDEQEGTIWALEQLEAAFAALPAALFEAVPYSAMRQAIATLLQDPWLAERALARPAEPWRELARVERTRALAALTSDPDWRAAARLVRASGGAPTDLIELARARVAGGLQQLDAAEKAGRSPADALALIDGANFRGGAQKNWPAGDLASVKDALKLLRERVREALKQGLVLLDWGPADDAMEALLPTMQAAFTQVQAHLTAAKRQRRVLDFNDLERHALQALADPAVQAYYAERWKAFLVDEFQDTNPVQAALIARLTEGAVLTIVGDEKQAIYGFRRADVAGFQLFRDRLVDAGGTETRLSQSFRTHQALLDGINRVFAPVLGDLSQDLVAARAEAPHAAPHLRVFAIEGDERKLGADHRRRAEATRIVARLKAMLDEGCLVHDKASGALRPIRPGDVAILARAWDPLEIYGEALAAAGIPAVHAGGGDLMATREAQDGWALLQFLADPSDTLALLAVLRGPCFAVSDRVLFEVSQALPDRHAAWWPAIEAETPSALARPVEVLRELVRERSAEPPARLLQLADRACGYTAVLGRLPGADRRLADWAGFVALVRELERGLQDVWHVVRRLRRLVAAEASFTRPPLEAGDAVSLMTVHAAKGLEWPVVVVPDLARRQPVEARTLWMDEQWGVALRLADEDGEAALPVLFTVLRQRQAALDEAERRRVLYVALTRARDHLLLSSAGMTGGALAFLQAGFDAAGIAVEPVAFDPVDAVPPARPSPPVPAEPTRWLLQPIGGDA